MSPVCENNQRLKCHLAWEQRIFGFGTQNCETMKELISNRRGQITRISSMDEMLCPDYIDSHCPPLWWAVYISANDGLVSRRFVSDLPSIAPLPWYCHAPPFCMDRVSTVVSVDLCPSSGKKATNANHINLNYSNILYWKNKAMNVRNGKIPSHWRLIMTHRFNLCSTVPVKFIQIPYIAKWWLHLMPIHFQCH